MNFADLLIQLGTLTLLMVLITAAAYACDRKEAQEEGEEL